MRTLPAASQRTLASLIAGCAPERRAPYRCPHQVRELGEILGAQALPHTQVMQRRSLNIGVEQLPAKPWPTRPGYVASGPNARPPIARPGRDSPRPSPPAAPATNLAAHVVHALPRDETREPISAAYLSPATPNPSFPTVARNGAHTPGTARPLRLVARLRSALASGIRGTARQTPASLWLTINDPGLGMPPIACLTRV